MSPEPLLSDIVARVTSSNGTRSSDPNDPVAMSTLLAESIMRMLAKELKAGSRPRHGKVDDFDGTVPCVCA